MPTTLVRTFVLMSIAIAGGRLLAQNTPQVPASQLLRVEEVEAGNVKTPEYDVSVQGMSIKRDGRRDWLMARAEYKTAKEWTDEVTVTFHVVLKADPKDLPAGARPFNLFSGTVTYMNVKKGDHVATMFLDPNTFERYGKIEAVAVVFSVDGEEAEWKAEPQPRPDNLWWERESANAIPLLKRSESPWALIEMERHETIKP